MYFSLKVNELKSQCKLSLQQEISSLLIRIWKIGTVWRYQPIFPLCLRWKYLVFHFWHLFYKYSYVYINNFSEWYWIRRGQVYCRIPQGEQLTAWFELRLYVKLIWGWWIAILKLAVCYNKFDTHTEQMPDVFFIESQWVEKPV